MIDKIDDFFKFDNGARGFMRTQKLIIGDLTYVLPYQETLAHFVMDRNLKIKGTDRFVKDLLLLLGMLKVIDYALNFGYGFGNSIIQEVTFDYKGSKDKQDSIEQWRGDLLLDDMNNGFEIGYKIYVQENDEDLKRTFKDYVYNIIISSPKYYKLKLYDAIYKEIQLLSIVDGKVAPWVIDNAHNKANLFDIRNNQPYRENSMLFLSNRTDQFNIDQNN